MVGYRTLLYIHMAEAKETQTKEICFKAIQYIQIKRIETNQIPPDIHIEKIIHATH